MPATYVIDPSRRIVYTRAYGRLTYEDGVRHMDELGKEPNFDPAFSQLLDFREATEVLVTAEEVRKLAVASVFAPDSKRAFVTASALVFGLTRIYEAYRSMEGDRGIRVFGDVAEAMEWLGIAELPALTPAPAVAPKPTAPPVAPSTRVPGKPRLTRS